MALSDKEQQEVLTTLRTINANTNGAEGGVMALVFEKLKTVDANTNGAGGPAGAIYALMQAVKTELDSLAAHSDPTVAATAARLEAALKKAGADLTQA